MALSQRGGLGAKPTAALKIVYILVNVVKSLFIKFFLTRRLRKDLAVFEPSNHILLTCLPHTVRLDAVPEHQAGKLRILLFIVLA